MTRTVWKMDATMLEGGDQLIYYAGGNGPFPGLVPLKRSLFGWHAASYYGTMIEEWKKPGHYGFVLPAWQAIGYWSGSSRLRHGPRLEWGREANELRQSALLLNTALEHGWFVPAVRRKPSSSGGAGGAHAGWRLLRAEESHPDPAFAAECERLGWETLDRRLSEALAALIAHERETAAAWEKVSEAFPAAVIVASGAATEAADDDELWETVGFRMDASSFGVGLWLSEPEDRDGLWLLRPWVYDRADPDRGELYDWNGRPTERKEGGGRIAESPNAAASAAVRRGSARTPSGGLGEESEIAAAIERRRMRWTGAIEGLSEPWHLERVWRFLERESEELLAQGIRVLLPSWWEELRKTRPAMVARLRPDAGASGLLSKDQLLAFDWQIAIGDRTLSREAFLDAIQSNRKLVRFDGQWMVLHPRWLRQLQAFLKRMGSRSQLSLSEVLEAYLSGGRVVGVEPGREADEGENEQAELVWQVRLNAPVAEWLAGLEDKERRQGDTPLPESLQPILRNYQKAGAGWLLSLREIGFGACLADDMGLGKTLQFISYLAALKAQGKRERPGLVICPTSVVGNWQKEVERFAPELAVYVHYGARREAGEAFARQAAAADLVITTYALANADAELLRGRQWGAIGLDEAQNIKNRHGKQSQAVRSFHADHRVALTGTPIENRLAELWTIFDIINPGYLGSYSRFQRQFGWLDKPPGEDNSLRREEATEKLQRMIRPFLMRRVKTDPAIQLDLPEKNESCVYVPLTLEQGSLYEAELQHMLEQSDRLEAMERRGVILATIGRLKRICDHPDLVRQDSDRVGFSVAHRDNASHKLNRLVEMAGEVLDERRKGIIFTQFLGMGEILRQQLRTAFDCRVDFLHGGVAKEARDAMVDRFQREEGGTDFLVLSLKAGGTGLNLTAATHVFHYDRWWNPAVEEQATDRAYRIGQTRNVQVHKFVALGTIEERIDEMIRRKRALSDRIVGSGEQWVTELTTDELRDMFALRREWVRD